MTQQPRHTEIIQGPLRPHFCEAESIDPPGFGDFDDYLFDPPLPCSTTRIIFFDGGARMATDRNTVVSAAAAVAVYECERGAWRKTYSEARLLTEKPSAQVAEHIGLLCAIKMAFKHKMSTTAVCGDNLNAIRQVTRYNDIVHAPLVKLCGRSIAMGQVLGPTLTLHHFTRNQHNPADTGCNEAMDSMGDVWDRTRARDYTAFADINRLDDEPRPLRGKRIPRLYQLRPASQNNGEPQAHPFLEDLAVNDVHCSIQTFWKVDDKAVGLLAACLVRTIAGVVGRCPATRLDSWRRFFLLPQSKLSKTQSSGNRKALRGQLADLSPPGKNRETLERKAAAFEQRQLNRATALATNGHLGKAARQLERTDVALPPNTPELPQALHPKSNWTPAPSNAEPAFLSIDNEAPLRIMKKQSSLKSPGPSAWTEDLLYQACLFSDECLALIAHMVRDICNNSIPSEMTDIIKACKLIPLPKTPVSVRPIAIGEAIVKIAEAVVFESVIDDVVEYLHPEQLAFDEAGCEKVIHNLRSELNWEHQSAA